MIIKVLGTGCANCKKLEKNTKKAIETLGLDATLEKVENLEDIMAYGVMGTPALVVDEKVVLSGQVASPKAIIQLLQS